MNAGDSLGGASLTDLRAMIADANPATLDTVAARWAAVALALQQTQDDFLHHTRAATAHWTGTAADAFSARATELHRSLGSGADYASHACSGVSFAADALRAARIDMPPEPASLQAATTSEAAQTTGTAADGVLEQQRKQAVAVMERLEERYAAAAEMIGNPDGSHISCDRGVFPIHGTPAITPQSVRPDHAEPQAMERSAHQATSSGQMGTLTQSFLDHHQMPTAAATPSTEQHIVNEGPRFDRFNSNSSEIPEFTSTGFSELRAGNRNPRGGISTNWDNFIAIAHQGPQVTLKDISESEGVPDIPRTPPSGAVPAPGTATKSNFDPVSSSGGRQGQHLRSDGSHGNLPQRAVEASPSENPHRSPSTPAAAQGSSGSKAEMCSESSRLEQALGPTSLSTGAPAYRGRPRSRRPCYLTGEPDDWATGIPPSNPPIIDH